MAKFVTKMAQGKPLLSQILNTEHLKGPNPLPTINFCDFAMLINGVTSNQVTLYTLPYDEMKQQVTLAGSQMVDHITLAANVTTTTPLEG